jgi:hypothetical protein
MEGLALSRSISLRNDNEIEAAFDKSWSVNFFFFLALRMESPIEFMWIFLPLAIFYADSEIIFLLYASIRAFTSI